MFKIYYSIESWTVSLGKRDTFSVTDDITLAELKNKFFRGLIVAVFIYKVYNAFITVVCLMLFNTRRI